MPPTTGVATVLSDGRVALPKEMREALGLRKGCRLELTVHRVLPSPEELEDALLAAVQNHETGVEEIEALVQQLISCKVALEARMKKTTSGLLALPATVTRATALTPATQRQDAPCGCSTRASRSGHDTFAGTQQAHALSV